MTGRDGRATGGKATGGKAAGGGRSGRQAAGAARAGDPKAGQPRAGQPRAGQPRAGQPRAGQPRAGQPRAGQPRAGQPRAGQARAGQQGGVPRRGATGRGAPHARSSRTPEAATDVVTVEGRQAVRELLRARRRAVHELLVAETVDVSGPVGEIIELAAAAGVPLRRVGRAQLDARAATDAPQGVLAVADPVREHELSELIGVSPGGLPPLIVVLDGVTDPHNLGAVMRSALCAGASGVVVGRHRAASIGAAATKAAAGAVEWLPVAVVTGIPAAVVELAEAGVWTVGLDGDAPTPVWDLAVASEAVALVLGAEGRGLSRLARQRCELLVSVPMQGPLDSLNVSAAATLACFEVARRRTARPAGGPSHAPPL